MKNIYIKALAALLIGMGTTSCGDDFLDAKIYNGIDIDGGLSNTTNIGYALNGTYYQLYQRYFAGNYATMIGDIASDISYWNTKTGHFDNIYKFSPTTSDTYLGNIWEYGYKVADNSARIIKAANELYDSAEDSEKSDLDEYLGEAYALRAYSQFVLVNVFGHQIKVNGTDFSSSLGIVVIDEPVPSGSQVKRTTVGDAYTAIENDLKKSIEHFEKAGWNNDGIFYMTPAAVYGLLSRVYLYEEKYSESAAAAKMPLRSKESVSSHIPMPLTRLYITEGQAMWKVSLHSTLIIPTTGAPIHAAHYGLPIITALPLIYSH